MDERIDQAESVVILRDLFLNEKVRGRLHLQHVSLSRSVEWMDLAKQRHIPFTAETCPHYFIEVEPQNNPGAYEVYPPLRDANNRQAILKAIASGLIDMIASDHAPHTIEDKMTDKPARGFSGVELLFPLCFDYLVRSEKMPLDKLLVLLNRNPSRLLGMEPSCFQEGKRADLFLFDPEEKWMVEPSVMHSNGKNTPFLGKRLTGRIKATIASGKMVFPFEGTL
jgi:dihydroorotase